MKAQAAQELPKKKRSEKRPGSGEVKAPGSSRQHKAFEKAEKKASPRAEKPVESRPAKGLGPRHAKTSSSSQQLKIEITTTTIIYI